MQTEFTKSLFAHPRNVSIYGSEEDSDLVERIHTSGWIKPLVVKRDGTIISGHRRWRAAIALGIDQVPVEYREFTNESDELEALLLENASRDKTVEQKVREAEVWHEIESDRAAKRRLATQNNDAAKAVPVNSPELDKSSGDTRDIVAAKIGMGGQKYSRAKKVVDRADALKEEGKTEEAKTLLDTLNNKSVNAAHKAVNQQDAAERQKERQTAEPSQSLITLHQGDMLEVLPSLGTFGLVVADPPYNVTDFEWDKFGNDFPNQIRLWLAAIKKSLANEYNLFWFCSPVYLVETEIALRELGLPIQSRIVWHRRNMTMGSDSDFKFIDTWEMIYHCGNRKLNWSPKWTDERFDVQTFAVPQSNFTDQRLSSSITQKPLELIKRLVSVGSYPGDSVLDPFAGSGTTGHACKDLGDRHCTLIEMQTEHIEIARSRLGL